MQPRWQLLRSRAMPPPPRPALPAARVGRAAAARRSTPRPDETFLEIGPGAGALTLAARRARGARGRGRARRARSPRGCARARPRTSTIVDGDALEVDLRRAASPRGGRARRQPALLRLEPAAAPLPRAARPRARRARDAAGGGRAARRVAAGLEGVRDPLRALRALGGRRHPAPLPARARSSPPPQGVLRPAPRPLPGRRRGPTSPIPTAFERCVQRAFARRRRTLENNLQDSYPNLKEHLRLLNIEGSRRPRLYR